MKFKTYVRPNFATPMLYAKNHSNFDNFFCRICISMMQPITLKLKLNLFLILKVGSLIYYWPKWK
jgi:hypothetical protein